MSKYTDPSSLTETLIEMAVGLLLVMVALWLAVLIWIHIWFWIVGGALVLGGVWLLVRWLRWRRSDWY